MFVVNGNKNATSFYLDGSSNDMKISISLKWHLSHATLTDVPPLLETTLRVFTIQWNYGNPWKAVRTRTSKLDFVPLHIMWSCNMVEVIFLLENVKYFSENKS
jgi:hypothetical protein